MAAEDPLTQSLTGLLGGLAGGALIVAVLTIVLKTFGEKLGEGLYGAVSTLPKRGFEWFARLISEDKRITHYRGKIPDEYGRHVLTRQRQIKVDSLYVHLQYEQGGRRHDLRARVMREKAVLLLGEAGAGKSLLLKYFLLKWAEEPRRTKDKQQLPVLVELHRCDDSLDLVGLIAARFRLSRDPDDARARDLVAKRLTEGSMRLLFDGLDEVSAEHQAAVVAQLEDFRRTHASGTDANSIVVTCRGSAYNGSLGAFEKIDIADFDDSSILRFLGRWLDVERSPSGGLSQTQIAELGTAERLFDQIRQSPQLAQLARTPLLLGLLADLYTGSLLRKGRTLPGSRTAFYSRVTDHMVTRDLLLDRGERASPYEPGDKLATLKRIALAMTETPAHEGDRLVMTNQRLREVLTATLSDLELGVEHRRELLRDIIDRSQMLVGSDTGERFRFPHRSFQEYFTARALEGPSGVDRLLAGYRSDPAFWRDTVRFWCGLDGNNSTAVIEWLFTADDIREKVLALECLAEASEVDSQFADRVISHFLAELPHPDRYEGFDGVVHALGLVAARDTDRGRRIRNALLVGAEASEYPAMDALARTGRADIAQFLVTLAVDTSDDTIFDRVRTMGEVAVPALAAVVSADRLLPMDILGEIGTPSAALCLAERVWMVSDAAPRAAWWIATLLRAPNIEAALGENGPRDDVGTMTFEVMDRAWDPFCENTQGRLSQLMRRVAHLTSVSTPPDSLIPRVDPRMAILLSARALVRIQRRSDEPPHSIEHELSDFLAEGYRRPGRTRPLDDQTWEDSTEVLSRLGLSDTEIQILATLTPDIRRLLVQQLMIRTAMPTDLNDGRHHATWTNAAPLWSRASRDAEHRTGGLHGVWGTITTLAAVSIVVAGTFRIVTTVGHSWPFGPTWLAWAMLIAGGIGILALAAMIFFDFAVDPDTDYGSLFVPGTLGIIVFLGGTVPPGVATIAHWLGWMPLLTFTGILLLIVIPVATIAYRLDKETDNPFRPILHAYRQSQATA